jgi:beta-N-acetylhexosaminidase
MTSHILLPQLDADNPATFSSRILQQLLREELGFDGVIVSDALDMVGASGEIGIPAAAVRAVAAGCDLLLYVLPADPADVGISVDGLVGSLTGAVESGRLSEERLDDAVERVLTLRRTIAVEETDSGTGE